MDPIWNNANSTEQIALQEYFTGAFKEIKTSGDCKFLSTLIPTHKKKKLYGSLVLKTLHIQVYYSSVDFVRLVSEDPKTLSIFVELLKSNTQYNSEKSRKSNITQICKELKRNKQNKTKQQRHRCKRKQSTVPGIF